MVKSDRPSKKPNALSVRLGSCPDCGCDVAPVTKTRQVSTQAGVPAELAKKVLAPTTACFKCRSCGKEFERLPNPRSLFPKF